MTPESAHLSQLKPRVAESFMRPWVSFLALHSGAEQPSISRLLKEVALYQVEARGAEVVAEHLANPGRLLRQHPELSEVDAIVFRVVGEPSWARGSNYENVSHELVVVVRRAALIALCTSAQQVREHIIQFVDRRQLLDHDRLSGEVLQHALLQGNIRTFWMGSARQPRRYRPRSMTTYGSFLEDSIDPIGYQGQTLNAARSTVSPDVGVGSDAIVGTSLQASTVWLRQSYDWRDFLRATSTLLGVLASVIEGGEIRDRFEIFAKPVPALDLVTGGYELAFDEPVPVPGGADDTTLHEGDQEYLLSTIIEVRASSGPAIDIDIGRDRARSATLRLEPRQVGKRISIEIGVLDVSDAVLLQEFRVRFNRSSPVIFYASGHSITPAGIFADNQTDIPFTSWSFGNFSDFDIQREKPTLRTREALFDLSPDNTDRCLFGWVCREFASGWLYCDDRGDEFADFISLRPSGELSIIHVKGSHADRDHARFAGQPYEQVAAQVEKNGAVLVPRRLIDALQARREETSEGPLWHDGVLSNDWEAFLSALRSRPAHADLRAVVVQPHLSETMLEAARVRSAADPQSDIGTLARLRRLDYLLHATNAAVQRSGARLVVIGRLEEGPAESTELPSDND